MHDQAWRLVDNKQVLVLENDRNGNRWIGNCVAWRDRPWHHVDDRAGLHQLPRSTEVSVDLHVTLLDPPLNDGARNSLDQPGDDPVDTLLCLLRRENESLRRHQMLLRICPFDFTKMSTMARS